MIINLLSIAKNAKYNILDMTYLVPRPPSVGEDQAHLKQDRVMVSIVGNTFSSGPLLG